MAFGRWGVAGLLAVTGLALWLLLGSGMVFGHDIGGFGITLLVAVMGVALYRVSRLPADELGQAASPAEWKAWVGLGFTLVATVYFLAKIELMGDADHVRAVMRNLFMLVVAWVVLSQVLAGRWKGRVQEDERDREIEARAGQWGRGALVFVIVGLMVTLGFSPPERLQWASHLMISNLLLLALMWGSLAECVATVVMYRRDRRLARA